MPSDELLWRQAVEGNAEAFAVVFDRHVNAVYTHVLRRGLPWADAEDITSMVFLEAWRQASKVRFVEESARPWLLLVATNVARNHTRARGRYQSAIDRLPPPEAEPDAADAAIHDVDLERSRVQLAAALSKLRQQEQDVIALCDLAELSYAEAAEVLDIAVGTVRSRLSRARTKLQKLLADDPPATKRPRKGGDA